MPEWSDVDFVITRRKMNVDGQVLALEGRVVEDSEPREQPLELTVAQIIDYMAKPNAGTFCTGLEIMGNIERGGDLEVRQEDDGEQLRLRTVEGTDERYYLNSLPTYQESSQ